MILDGQSFICDCLFKLGLTAYGRLVNGDTNMLKFYALIVIEHSKRNWSFVKHNEVVSKLKLLRLI